MAIERNFLGFEMGDLGELIYGSGGSLSLTSAVNDGTARSGSYYLRQTASAGSSNLSSIPAGTIVGTTGTVTSGNHKRVSLRAFFRIESTFNNGQQRIIGFGNDAGTCTVYYGAQNVGGFIQAGAKIGLRIGAQSHQLGVAGAYPWSTVDLTTGVWYRLLLDIDLNVAGTTVLSATLRITTDSDSPAVDFTLTNSDNIGATDNVDKLAFGYSTAPGAFGKQAAVNWDDVIYIATSNADAVSAATLPTQTHIYAIVPPTGVALNQWSGTYTAVDEYPVSGVDTMSSSTALAEVEFTHASGIALGYGLVSAMKLHVNALVSGAGTGSVDYILNGVAKNVTLAVNYPASAFGADPIGGILWADLLPSAFAATTFGIKKQNGTQSTVMANIGLEIIGTLADYNSGNQIRGETQIKAGSIYDAQISDAASIQRHKIQGFGGGPAPVFVPEDYAGDDWIVPGPPGSSAPPARVPVVPVFFPEEAEDAMLMAASASSGSGGGSVTNNYTNTYLNGHVLLAELVASASASLDLTARNITGQSGALFQSDYDEYVLEFVNLQPATNSVGIQVRMSTNGGSSWASGAADYRWSFMAYGSGGPGNTSSTGATSISIIGFANISNNVLNVTSGYLRIFNPLSTTNYKMVGGHSTYWDATPTLVTGEVVGAYQSTTAVNALQVFMSSGNITAGAVRVYGVAKSGSVPAAPGAMVLLEQHTASASAQLDFTTAITSLYDDYMIEFVNVRLATNNIGLRMLCSTNGGSSYDTSAIYDSIFHYVSTTSSTGQAGATGGTFCDINDNSSNVATQSLNGTMKFYDPLSTVTHKSFHGLVNYGHNTVGRIFVQRGFLYKNTAAVNALRFIPASGNITDGTIRIYGIAK